MEPTAYLAQSVIGECDPDIYSGLGGLQLECTVTLSDVDLDTSISAGFTIY